ncbi:MAG: HDIG domain-containing protein [Actinomycetia bacterium]|nr:HDIG domain-containing protein [Actinomycetes bacterium]
MNTITRWSQRHSVFVKSIIVVMTVAFVAVVLMIGYDSTTEIPAEISVGAPAPQDFIANESTSEIPDDEKTARAQKFAADNVPAPLQIDNATTQVVINDINRFYTDLDAGTFLPVEDPEPVLVPDLVGSTLSEASRAAADVGLVTNIGGSVPTLDEELDATIAVQTPAAGSSVDEGTMITLVVFRLEGSTTTTTPQVTTTTTIAEVPEAPRRSVEDQFELLNAEYQSLDDATLLSFIDLHEKDLDRVADGESSVFPDMQLTSIGWARNELVAGIKAADLEGVKNKYLSPDTIPPIFIPGIPEGDVLETQQSLGSLVSNFLQSNEVVDQQQWDADKQAASDAVPIQTTRYVFGDVIAREGDVLTSVEVAAITELGLYEEEVTIVAPAWALGLVGAISVLIFALMVWRIAPNQVRRIRDTALLGIIVGLAVLTARVPELVTSPDNHSIGYVMPAVAIGVMTAILFNPRSALLMVIPMAAFTAIASQDITFTVYAGIAAAVPVAFVSSVSTRSQLRLSVIESAALVVPVAVGLEFLFHFGSSGSSALMAAFWAFVGAVVGGFLAQGIVSFMETAFGVTTTMSLLDLLDRNHPALKLLEEKAPGTFNHSMLVGSLAGKAARSIGADPLLAQAAAWYHDLGKTENPQYFVENQLGYNPHDQLTPEESAEVIRNHVSDGLDLAKQYRIPEEVANGIRMHHGTSIMRFFYHKALKDSDTVDPDVFRHRGTKPTRKEMAIVMISDSSEAAARAYAQSEQPTEEGLVKLVDSIVSEKLDDGQFDESSLTFGELTRLKKEIVDGLSAYYHARVEYPDFPTGETPVVS